MDSQNNAQANIKVSMNDDKVTERVVMPKKSKKKGKQVVQEEEEEDQAPIQTSNNALVMLQNPLEGLTMTVPKGEEEKVVTTLGIRIVDTDEKEPLKVPHAKLLELIKDESNDDQFILYKKKRLLHKNILKEYIVKYGEENIGSIIKRATEKQTVILT